MQRSRDPGRAPVIAANAARTSAGNSGRRSSTGIACTNGSISEAFEAEHVLLRHAADDACDGADTAVELARRGGPPGRARRERDGAASSNAARERRCCPRCRSAPRSRPTPAATQARHRRRSPPAAPAPGRDRSGRLATSRSRPRHRRRPAAARWWRCTAAMSALAAEGGSTSRRRARQAARQVIRKPTRDWQRLHTADASARRCESASDASWIWRQVQVSRAPVTAGRSSRVGAASNGESMRWRSSITTRLPVALSGAGVP